VYVWGGNASVWGMLVCGFVVCLWCVCCVWCLCGVCLCCFLRELFVWGDVLCARKFFGGGECLCLECLCCGVCVVLCARLVFVWVVVCVVCLCVC